MKAVCRFAIAVVLLAASSEGFAQDLNIDDLSPDPPPAFPVPAPGEHEVAAGGPQYGYQFEFGSFSIQPAGPTARGIFTLTTQQFPQPPAVKLYDVDMTYVGFNSGGPHEGAVFECTVNGNQRYVLFGTVSQGTQQGAERRRLRYYNSSGQQTFATIARFYAP